MSTAPPLLGSESIDATPDCPAAAIRFQVLPPWLTLSWNRSASIVTTPSAPASCTYGRCSDSSRPIEGTPVFFTTNSQ